MDTLYQGILDYAGNYCTDIIGGDITAAPVIMVTITVIGEVEKGEALRRDRARPGDMVFVTGNLGDSRAGLKILSKKTRARLSAAEYIPVKKHLVPQPAYMEGRVLLASKMVNACMDVSDGIVSDLARICEESSTGADIFVDKLPVSFSAGMTAAKYGEKAADYALYGGEDFVLLFTVAEKNAEKLLCYLGQNSIMVFEAGRITAKKGIRLVKNGKKTAETGKKAWNHF
jgi:thiamine-monophosphate kinase